MCDLLFGITDLLSFVLMVLPLYPRTVNGQVYSVSLFAYTETTALNRSVCWTMLLALVLTGIVKTLLTHLKIEKAQKTVTGCSMVLGIFTVIFLALAGEAYAVTVAFLLLIKGSLLFRYVKAGG